MSDDTKCVRCDRRQGVRMTLAGTKLCAECYEATASSDREYRDRLQRDGMLTPPKIVA